MREIDPAVKQFLRAHGVKSLAIAFLLILTVNAFFGATLLVIPSAEGTLKVPFRREIPVIYASLIAGGMHSPMHTFEEASSHALRRMQISYLFAAAALAVLCVGASEVLLRDQEAGVQAARATLAWLAFAIMSGRVLGWRLTWILPILTIFPLVYYGHGNSGHVNWWDWTSRPAGDPLSWALTISLVFMALVTFWVTPWRVYTARRILLRIRV